MVISDSLPLNDKGGRAESETGIQQSDKVLNKIGPQPSSHKSKNPTWLATLTNSPIGEPLLALENVTNLCVRVDTRELAGWTVAHQ